MTREEAISKWVIPAIRKTWNEKRCKEILEALEQEPCDDAISRKFLLDHAVYAEFADGVKGWIVEKGYVEDALTVQPQPKTGHWTHDGSHWKNRFICSECNYKLFDEPTNYCPNCGANMEVEK